MNTITQSFIVDYEGNVISLSAAKSAEDHVLGIDSNQNQSQEIKIATEQPIKINGITWSTWLSSFYQEARWPVDPIIKILSWALVVVSVISLLFLLIFNLGYHIVQRDTCLDGFRKYRYEAGKKSKKKS